MTRAPPAIETTLSGPTLRFNTDTVICLGGAELAATLDGEPVAYWQPRRRQGRTGAEARRVTGPASRAYIAVRGGIDVPEYLGSRATFTLGKFGGHAGRTLRRATCCISAPRPLSASKTARPAAELKPRLTHDWDIGVLYGPHGAPDFFTPEDIETFFAADWEVHYNRTRPACA